MYIAKAFEIENQKIKAIIILYVNLFVLRILERGSLCEYNFH